MSDSTELRRIVGAMTERPWRTVRTLSYDPVILHGADESTIHVAECRTAEDAGSVATLANHADALVALVEACERLDASYTRDNSMPPAVAAVVDAIAAVHDVKETK